MKTKIAICTLVLMFSAFVGNVFGGTEGTDSTAYGLGAGYNSSYLYNTFIGVDAGNRNTGSHNTFVGSDAGSYNTTGFANTFLGTGAGTFNAAGYANTFLGAGAGAHSTRSGNTFVGYNAGANNISGGNNVFLGDSAGMNEISSDKLYIENGTQSTPLIYGDFSNSTLTVNGSLGIGTQAPVRMLHLSGSNAVVRMDRTSDTAAFQMIRTDSGGTVQKVFVVGTNYSPTTGLGEFVINDNGTALSGGGTRRMTMANDGAVTFTGNVFATAFNPSSLTLKNNVRTYENALDTVNRLRGVSFDWKDSGKPAVGLIAEEVAKVVPEVVAYNDGAATGVNYASLVGVLVEAVKEQEVKLEKQEGFIQEQQNAILTLQKELNELKGRIR